MNTKLLRQKILDLAIRGKLTQQKKSDGTTKDLLVSIAASSACHSERSAKSAKSSRVILSKRSASKDLAKEIIPLDKSEAPFEIPENWEWVRLGDIASDFQYGSSEKSKPEGKVAVLRMGNINRMGQVVYDDLVYTSTESEITKYALDVGDVLFNRTNSPEWVGKTALYRGEIPAIYAGYIIRIKPKFLPEYLNYLMCSKYERDWAHEVKTDGVHQSNINAQKLIEFAVPLPPLAEQQRIVTAIENAFAEITEIENNQELLKKHIKQGRQKILDLAIRGKLTEQKKSDGTTKDLLKQISSNVILSNAKNPAETAKSSRVIQSKRSASKDLAKQIIPLDKTTAPFEIPSTWEWVRLGDYLDVRDGTHDSPKYVEVGYPFVTSKNLVNGTIDFSTCKQVSKDDYDKFNERSCVEDGDILYAMIGSIGNAVLVKKDRDFAIKNVALFKKRFSQTDMNYVYYWLYFVEKSLKENAAGGLQPFISLSMFRDNSFPLPPLAEQQRIVATIEQAFAEFDAMEVNL